MQKIGTKQKSEIFQIFWIDNQDDFFPFNDEENVEIALRYSKEVFRMKHFLKKKTKVISCLISDVVILNPKSHLAMI